MSVPYNEIPPRRQKFPVFFFPYHNVFKDGFAPLKIANVIMLPPNEQLHAG